MAKKKNVLNDGVENAEEQQNIHKRRNMPAGKKRPQITAR